MSRNVGLSLTFDHWYSECCSDSSA